MNGVNDGAPLLRRTVIAALLLAAPAAPLHAGSPPRPPPHSPARRACEESVREIVREVAASSSEDERLRRLAAWADGRVVSCCQAAFIITGAWVEPAKMLRGLRVLAPRIADRGNVEIVTSVFAMPEDRDAARAIVRNGA